MLGKQGWKLISNPSAMISLIFKAKYFPNGDFLNSKLVAIQAIRGVASEIPGCEHLILSVFILF